MIWAPATRSSHVDALGHWAYWLIGAPRRGPAALLWLEAAAGAAAVLAGLRPLLDAKARDHAVQPRPDRVEAARRAAIGVLFGLHTIRFGIYLQPDRGRRQPG